MTVLLNIIGLQLSQLTNPLRIHPEVGPLRNFNWRFCRDLVLNVIRPLLDRKVLSSTRLKFVSALY